MPGHQRPIEPTLFHSLDPLRLAGSQCSSCATVTFPVQEACPRCGAETTDVALPDQGRLWTWTVQAFEPKPPYRAPADGFTPYAVGYVDLVDVLVESRIDVPEDELEIGMPLRL